MHAMRRNAMGGYSTAGHAKKLQPIIGSLDYYDHDPEAWRELRGAVEHVTAGWDALLSAVPRGSAAEDALRAQRDACFEALRLQSDLFYAHRRVCVAALRLQKT